MITRRAFVPLGVMWLGGAAASAQDVVFRSDVSLVRVIATVKNDSGELIGGLSKDDFEVRDNGVRQEIAVFEHHTELPLSIALLIDTSASTAIDLQYEVESVQRFLRALLNEGNPADAVSLYSFSWETVLLSDFTRRISKLESALKPLKTGGGTSLYDAICFAGEALSDREGRHVIIVVTDGGDTTSAKSFHEALEATQRADAVMYPILVMPITNDAGRNIGGENALTMLAQGTGGRVFTPGERAALDRAFSDIIRELRTQYLLGYYPRNIPPSEDSFHRLSVKLTKRPELRVSARSGYYSESAPARGGWRRSR